MTTEQRRNIRQALMDAGFRRVTSGEEPKHYDRAHDGVYTEEWRSRLDRTKITLDWDRKTEQ